MAKKSTHEKKRVNPFDVVVVLLVICLLVSLGYRVYVGIADETNRNVSEYVIEFESKDCKSILSYLSSGTAVYMASNGELLGYLYASEDDGYRVVYELPSDDDEVESGAPQTTPLYSTVKFGGKIRLSADTVRVKNGEYYTVGGYNLTIGSVIEIYTEKTVFTITVKSFDTVNE